MMDVIEPAEPLERQKEQKERTNAFTLSTPPSEAINALRLLTISFHEISARARLAATGVEDRT